MILSDLVSRLGALNLDAVARSELERQGAILADRVRDALSTLPGGPHDHPWLQSGGLRDSITHEAEGDDAVVGSRSPVALFQEHGTATLPPRPTFAPVASERGADIANSIAIALSQAIRSA
jgi:phage gpG-like protein